MEDEEKKIEETQKENEQNEEINNEAPKAKWETSKGALITCGILVVLIIICIVVISLLNKKNPDADASTLINLIK